MQVCWAAAFSSANEAKAASTAAGSSWVSEATELSDGANAPDAEETLLAGATDETRGAATGAATGVIPSGAAVFGYCATLRSPCSQVTINTRSQFLFLHGLPGSPSG